MKEINNTTMSEREHHIYMQDKMFPDWRKYWKYTQSGSYERITKVNLQPKQ